LFIAMRAFYGLSLWITPHLLFTYPDLHHRLLREQVEQLEQQAALLRDNLKGQGTITRFFTVCKDLSPLFAFLALGVSFCTLLFTFVWLKPDVRAIRGPSLQVSYQPKNDELRFDFRATIANFGRQMDVVKSMQGELSSPSTGSHKIYFSSRTGDLTLKDATHDVTFPFTVREKTAIDVDIHMSQVLGSSAKNSFFSVGQAANVSRSHFLRIDLKMASNKDASARYCFEFRDEVLTEIENGQTKEILGVECGGEG
jgi:hypothetical protein